MGLNLQIVALLKKGFAISTVCILATVVMHLKCFEIVALGPCAAA